MHSALEKARIPCECKVYRGASSSALGKLRFLPDNMLVGHLLLDKGFMSTSLERGDAFDDDLLLEIEVPKNSRGVYVGYISAAGHYESEVLFDVRQVMKIKGVSRNSDGRKIINVVIMNKDT